MGVGADFEAPGLSNGKKVFEVCKKFREACMLNIDLFQNFNSWPLFRLKLFRTQLFDIRRPTKWLGIKRWGYRKGYRLELYSYSKNIGTSKSEVFDGINGCEIIDNFLLKNVWRVEMSQKWILSSNLLKQLPEAEIQLGSFHLWRPHKIPLKYNPPPSPIHLRPQFSKISDTPSP